MGQDETVSSRQGTKRKRGPFRDSEQRIETGLTRKLGACISCSMQRIRCVPDPQNPSGCCRTCIQAARTRLYWLPCLRYKIPDAELLDHAACPRPSWSRRWKKMEIMDIPAQHWASKEIKTIQITQDVGGTCYKLKVRQFKPTDGDSLERRWKTNGKPQYFKCTPYAIANMKEAGKVLSEFADRTVGTAISHYIDETDVLLRSTYTMAYRYSRMAERDQERDLLRAVLRLWCASRMESHSDRICGDETLGMTPQDYGRDCPNTGMILTPPVFSAQLEVIVVATILQPAKKEVLQRLKDLMQENHGRQSWQQPCWFTIYLAMFVLLHSCAMLTAGDNKKARKQGSEARFFRHSVVESLHNGAKILLAYFHYCNKGSRPFSMDWSSPDQMARAGLDTEQAEFMRLTANEVQKRTVNFRQIREQGIYEHDYYFISQLYDSDWKPKHTI
ncbi:uncharacterized protein BDR25DRAFT_217243 [Lindgomyces ingoldianus]|uniref:Uncharacterized protein n=1 Tax=Lindgomyces ingoldianus TaxID=673940 RepID=A0ACB6R5M4_9PLEO|nr:uncharacterized protein BDR25DRAFT_217243 [Lindgomyces ingoldianus]KAF2473832.1 hypothetical protein BDR25DRAFT_217243 [Lindgomyces ingoldianus]